MPTLQEKLRAYVPPTDVAYEMLGGRRHRQTRTAIVTGTLVPFAVNTAVDYIKGQINEYAKDKALKIIDRVQKRKNPSLRGYSAEKIILDNNKMPKIIYRRRGGYRSSSSKKPSSKKYSQQKNGSTVYKKTYRKAYRKKTTLRKQVKTLKKAVESDNAHHTYKQVQTGTFSSAVGLCNHDSLTINTAGNIEGYCANLRYFNPATPGTLTTANPATGTYSSKIHFDNVYSKLMLRNNYQVPVKVKVYLVKPKGDTNINPHTYYSNGITDQVIGGGDETTPTIYLNDIDVFKEQWSIKVLKDVVLDAGAWCEVKHSTGKFDYDPSLFDSHTVAYQPKFKSAVFMIRLEGVLGHDTTVTTEHTNLAGQVDYMRTTVAKITYDAGVNLNDIYISDGRDASFTNGGVVSSKPVADNIGYSLS